MSIVSPFFHNQNCSIDLIYREVPKMVQVFDYRTVIKQVSNTLKIGKKIKGNGLTATLEYSFPSAHPTYQDAPY